MSLFHRHQWKTLTRNFTPGRTGSLKMAQADHEYIERLLYGITTINQECQTCGLGRAYTVAGDAR